MKCTILHEGKGRMRVHVENVRMTLHHAHASGLCVCMWKTSA